MAAAATKGISPPPPPGRRPYAPATAGGRRENATIAQNVALNGHRKRINTPGACAYLHLNECVCVGLISVLGQTYTRERSNTLRDPKSSCGFRSRKRYDTSRPVGPPKGRKEKVGGRRGDRTGDDDGGGSKIPGDRRWRAGRARGAAASSPGRPAREGNRVALALFSHIFFFSCVRLFFRNSPVNSRPFAAGRCGRAACPCTG